MPFFFLGANILLRVWALGNKKASIHPVNQRFLSVELGGVEPPSKQSA